MLKNKFILVIGIHFSIEFLKYIRQKNSATDFFCIQKQLNLHRMKSIHLVLITLFLVATQSFSQVHVDQITYNGRDHYITTTIGYPVPGTFLVTGKKEPATILNADGTGVIQSEIGRAHV